MADRHLGPTSTFIFQLTTTTTITTTAAISTTNDISNIITNDNNSIISNSIINNSINNSISNNNSSVSNIITTGGRTTTEIIIWSFLLLMITMASLLGNGLVIACVRIHHRLREEQSNMFIVNLSVTDMLSAVLIMLSSLHALAGDRWMLGPVWCDVVCAANYTLIIVSMLTLCFIALDRYMAVLHALHYHRVITPNKIYLLISYAWFQGLCFGLAPVMAQWISYDYWEIVCAIEWHEDSRNTLIYVIVAFVVCFFLPGAILALAYSKVMKVAQEHHEHLNSQRISSSPSYRSRTRVSCMHDELATTVHRSSTRNSLRFPESSRRQNGGVNGVEETGEEKRNQRLLEHEGPEQWSANLSNHSDPRIHHSSGARPVNAAKTANHKTDCRSPMSENGESSLELQNLRYTCGNVCPSVSSTNNSTTKPTDQNDPWQNPDKNADRGSGLSSAELLTENAAITASTTTTTTSETATTKTTTSLKPQMSSEFHPESGRTLAWVENGVTGPANVFGPVKRFTVGNNYDDDDDEDDEDNTSFSGVTTSPNMLAQLGSIEGTKQLVDCAIAVAIPSYRGNMTSLWSRRVSYPKDVGSPQTDHRLRSRQWADHNSFDQRGHNQISESDVSTTSSNNPLVQPNLAWSDNTLSMSDIRCVEHEPGQGGTTTTTTTTTTIITKPNPSPSIPQPHHQNHHHHNNKKNNNTSTQSQPSPNTPQRQLDLHDLRPLNPAYPPNHQHNEDNNTVVTDSSRASKADLSNPIDKSKVLLRTSAQQHQLQESSKISQEDPTRKRLNVTHCATATTPTTTATKTTTTPATTTTTSTQQGHTHSSPQHIAKISSTTTHKRLTGTSYNEATTLTPGSAAGSRDVTTGTTRRSPGAKDTLTRQSKQRSYSASNKAVRSLLIVVLAYFICMTPFSITKLYKVIVGRPDALPGYVNLTASLCQFCSSAINPLIYGIFRRDFQRAFLMILRRFMVRARVTERQSPDTLSYQLN